MKDFKFNAEGLIPAIIQDEENGEVLMLAYMDKTALERTLTEKKTVFFSRSRNKYWVKGETSGHLQTVKQVFTDCDKDTILIKVRQIGGACHLGYRTCFVHLMDSKGEITGVTQKKVFDPGDIYNK